MCKKIICLFLAIIMLVSLIPAYAFAESGNTVNGSVRYCSGHGENTHDYEGYFSYSDDYFTKSAYKYRQDLASASFALALAAFSSKEASSLDDEDKNFISMMEQCGFTDIDSNEWFGKAPICDSIGVCAASKGICDNGTDYTLIAIGVRGNFYRREWGGNANLGPDGEHAGFALCREQTLKYIRQYIDNYNISGPIKLWISGYSRAAATANLVTAKLDLGYELSSKVSLSPNDIYCYCFETPMGALKSETGGKVFGNIQNVINQNDLVTYLAFDQWNFGRYGIDRVVPTKGDADYEELKAAMLEEFNTIPNNGDEYIIDDFKYIGFDISKIGTNKAFVEKGNTLTQKEYYRLLADAMTHDFVSSRKDYFDNVQSGLVEILAVIFNRTELDFGYALELFAKKVQDNYQEILNAMQYPGDLKAAYMYKQFEDMLFESLNESNITLFNAQQLRHTLYELVTRLVNMTIKHPNVTATLLANAETIISAHFAEVCMAWMHTLPDDYMTSKESDADHGGIFSDVDGNMWYSEFIAYNYFANLMNGMGDNEFRPDSEMTRGMFAAVIYRLAGSPDISGLKEPFPDVSKTDWYYNAVVWAYNAKIIKGFEDGTFSPDLEITRSEAITMLYRYNGAPLVKGSIRNFSDAGAVYDYAKSAFVWAINNGIITGYPEGTIYPNLTATRAELAAITARFCEM